MIYEKKLITYKDLRVYQNAMDAAMEIFQVTKGFPIEEKYSLIDQIRRSSRSVCANIGEAWRKKRYKAAFIAKLNDVETEACETQIWIELANKCGYLTNETSNKLHSAYDQVISQVVRMIDEPYKWLIKPTIPDSPIPQLSSSNPFTR